MGGGVREDGILQVSDTGSGGPSTPVNITAPLGPNVAADSVSVTLATDEDPIEVEIVGPLGQATEANSIPVVLASDQPPIDVNTAPSNDTAATGAIAALNDSVSITLPQGYNSVAINITGTLVGNLTFLFNGRLVQVFNPNRDEWFLNLVDPDEDFHGNLVVPIIAGNAYQFTVLCNAYTSGGLTVNLTASLTGPTYHPLTNTELRESPLDITGPVTVIGPVDVVSTPADNTEGNGTIDALNEFVSITPPKGYNSISFAIIGTFSGTLQFRDAMFETPYPVFDIVNGKWITEIVDNVNTTLYSLPVTGILGAVGFKVICTAYTSGSVFIVFEASLSIPTYHPITDAELALRINTLGQKTMANSTPVVLASDQSAVTTKPFTNNDTSQVLDSLFESLTIFPMEGYNSIGIVLSGTFSGTLQFQDINDEVIPVFDIQNSKWITQLVNHTGVSYYSVPIIPDANTSFAVKVTAYTSGAVTAFLGASLTNPTYHPLTAIELREVPLRVNTKTDLTPSAPAVASVGIASASAVAAAATRKGLHLRNLSNARISLGFGSPAVLDSGITLFPHDTFEMSEYDFDLGAVNAIASAAASPLAIQEYLT